MRFTTGDGLEVEVDLRFGFTVHNQDGTSAQLVHLENPRIVGGWPPPSGGGEPLPVGDVA
jgi:hypothetical protein